ncbi:probable 39S ribosomal protein L45, mitochondrial [Uranotaenia lowii]|uniref:probable 39S ribosomal protein L45, mitochondrial n=1 Tax=Uranotaenia lowii TaxID=190385 RepID=UPI00247A3E0F|nr:probable 39S ribosomal protein L45, mitochondrial [Uranotaenia lowii]
MASITALRSAGIHFLQLTSNGFLAPCIQNAIAHQQVRHRRTKHWDPQWKGLRKQKFIKVDIPNMNERVEDMSQEQIKTRMKERGMLPPRPWMERPFYISCTGGVFEPYIPPEGDGKMSAVSKEGAKQKFELAEKKVKSMMAIRKIRNYDEDFESKDFAHEAQDLYVKAHTILAEKNKYLLREVVTERAYPEMMHNIKDKTIRWKFLKSLEPPHVVHARCTDVITKENIFAQVTVRFHTQQMLAIYDRFGRLMHGSETLAKDCLEYVVFEKHLSNEYGVWRLHEKIVPDWMPPKSPAFITYRVDDVAQVPAQNEEESKAVEVTNDDKDKVAATQ